jgi:hypothetical protein
LPEPDDPLVGRMHEALHHGGVRRRRNQPLVPQQSESGPDLSSGASRHVCARPSLVDLGGGTPEALDGGCVECRASDFVAGLLCQS